MSEKMDPARDSYGGPPPPYGTHEPPHGQAPPLSGQSAYPKQQPQQGGFTPYPPNFQGPPPPAGAFVSPPNFGTTTATTIVVHQIPRMSPNPMGTQCPHCQSQIVTEINFVPGSLAWIICIVCIVLGAWCGCCLIPFCMPECQDVEHRCPNCKQFLGVYRRL